jgi:hypothetical protein
MGGGGPRNAVIGRIGGYGDKNVSFSTVFADF